MYGELFQESMQTVESYGLTLCAIVIENIPAQSSGLDDTLSVTNYPAIHVKCFAHMVNLIMGNCRSKPHFASVMEILIETSSLLRTPGAITAIGRRLYMVNTLEFICSHVDVITGCLTDHESTLNGIPSEFLSVHSILLLFALFCARG
jgi:hypothetical protein